MALRFAKIEQSVFRLLNAVVEPAVRRGIGSSALTPASLIVLETVGFKSGATRRTPLWSICLGRYRIVSTARGDRSFWVKNLLKQPKAIYYLGGKPRKSRAIVIAPGTTNKQLSGLTPMMRRLAKVFSRLSRDGWAFAILVPATT
jgi:deazaflavin-dependent oxidoreductase (nitroreductase family)